MDDATPAPAAPDTVGESLRAAREARGLSLADLAERTRIPVRHLEAIEASNYAGLPSPTYATGFAKAYARAVGADEVVVARRVRGELARVPRQPDYQPYEAPDPKRVPSRGLTVVTLGLAVAVIVLIGLWFAGFLTAGRTRTDTTVAAVPDAAPARAPVALPSPVPTPAPAASAGGTVTLATTGRVWMRVHDGDRTLFDGTMDAGKTFDVPADAKNPLVDIGRPDKLTISLNGRAAPALPPSDHPVTDLRVGAAAVAARLAGGTAPAPSPSPSVSPSPSASPTRATRHERPRHRDEAPRRSRRDAGDETARANRAAASGAPTPATTPPQP